MRSKTLKGQKGKQVIFVDCKTRLSVSCIHSHWSFTPGKKQTI